MNRKSCLVMFFVLVFAATLLLPACGDISNDPDYDPPERPHLYWKDIDAEVVDINKRHWFGGTHWYQVNITVRNDEYDLECTKTYKGSGMFGCPSQWGYEVGDIVSAELYSWVMDSTGEVVKREINKIY